jgi:hypothetical protein
MRRLTTGIHSQKCVVRRLRRCANVIECFFSTVVPCILTRFFHSCTVHFDSFFSQLHRAFWLIFFTVAPCILTQFFSFTVHFDSIFHSCTVHFDSFFSQLHRACWLIFFTVVPCILTHFFQLYRTFWLIFFTISPCILTHFFYSCTVHFDSFFSQLYRSF